MQKIHFKAPNCWINDPNGFIWYKGQYHLFYQCFPYSAHWGRMHWGHAVSTDLVNWDEKGIALFPSKTDDRSGCFSGSAVEYKDKMYIYYTGVNYTEEDPENINCCINDTFTAAQLMPGGPDDHYTVWLDHEPRDFKNAAAAGADLILSGHTHGGQVWPAGAVGMVAKNERNYGRKNIADHCDAIVSGGTGTWGYKFRTQGRTEIVCAEITTEREN